MDWVVTSLVPEYVWAESDEVTETIANAIMMLCFTGEFIEVLSFRIDSLVSSTHLPRSAHSLLGSPPFSEVNIEWQALSSIPT